MRVDTRMAALERCLHPQWWIRMSPPTGCWSFLASTRLAEPKVFLSQLQRINIEWGMQTLIFHLERQEMSYISAFKEVTISFISASAFKKTFHLLALYILVSDAHWGKDEVVRSHSLVAWLRLTSFLLGGLGWPWHWCHSAGNFIEANSIWCRHFHLRSYQRQL